MRVLNSFSSEVKVNGFHLECNRLLQQLKKISHKICFHEKSVNRIVKCLDRQHDCL